MSSGTRVWTRLHAALARFSDQIGETRRGIGLGQRMRGGRALARDRPGRRKRARACRRAFPASVRSARTRQPAPAFDSASAFGVWLSSSACGSGMRIAGRPMTSELAHRASAGTRDDEMRLRHARGRSLKKRRELGLHAGVAHRPHARIEIFGAALLHDVEPRAQVIRQAAQGQPARSRSARARPGCRRTRADERAVRRSACHRARPRAPRLRAAPDCR